MCFIIKKQISWLLKNPIYYIGIILVFFSVYKDCYQYLDIKPFEQNAIIETLPREKIGDADISDGYLPANYNEKEIIDAGLKKLSDDLIKGMGLSKEEVNNIIDTVKEQDMDKKEVISFIKKECYYISNVENYFNFENDMKKGTVEELNSYIKESLGEENYTEYFAKKYSDYLGVCVFFFALIMLAFVVIYDYKKDIYELLHTKPIKPWKYVVGKTLGGIFAICIAVFVITLIFDIMVVIKGSAVSFPVNVLDIWRYVLICNIPIIFYIGFMYIFIASLFRTPLPALPILLLLGVYSNLGTTDKNGIYRYVHKPFSVMVRFPGNFFETKFEKMQYLNQSILILCTIVFACIAIYRWNRRRL